MSKWPSLVETSGDLSTFSRQMLRADPSTASSITTSEPIPDTATVDAVNSEGYGYPSPRARFVQRGPVLRCHAVGGYWFQSPNNHDGAQDCI
jgi:hypothetical protein